MSARAPLLAALRRHPPSDERETAMLAAILAFVEAHPDCFERGLRVGHVTGSAWVVDASRQFTLLVHHKRLDKWLQPGGHADGSPDILGVALRETREETGLAARPVTGEIFDVDAHEIPARRGEPAHVHYDIRYLLEADGGAAVVVSPESRDVRWVRLEEVAGLNTDASVLRMVRKTLAAMP